MVKKSVCIGLLLLFSGLILAARGLPPNKVFSYNYTFKPGTEPDGFRGIPWQKDIAALDPLHTMEVIEILGPYTYYRKNHEDLHLGMADLQSIVYEFWNGKFSGVMIKVKGEKEFQRLRNYCFSRFGPGQRSEVYQRLDVQDFYYNGLKTRMSLRYSDYDRIGELNMSSIAMLSKQQKTDDFYLRSRAREQLRHWEKSKGK
jgi:hypothetical protein